MDSSASDSLIGMFAELPVNQLPKQVDVLRSIQHLKLKEHCDNNWTETIKSVVFSKVADNVIEIWHSARIPTSEKKNVVKMVSNLSTKYQDLKRKATKTQTRKVDGPVESASCFNLLFDILVS